MIDYFSTLLDKKQDDLVIGVIGGLVVALILASWKIILIVKKHYKTPIFMFIEFRKKIKQYHSQRIVNYVLSNNARFIFYRE